jgi:hypothetical protein
MTPYCLYCNVPIDEGEELIQMAKIFAYLTCDHCKTCYQFNCLYAQDINPFIVRFNIEIKKHVELSVHLTHTIIMPAEHKRPPRVELFYNNPEKQQARSLGWFPVETAFVPLEQLKNRFIKLLPFI